MACEDMMCCKYDVWEKDFGLKMFLSSTTADPAESCLCYPHASLKWHTCLSLSPQIQDKKVANANLGNSIATSKEASDTQFGYEAGHDIAMAG